MNMFKFLYKKDIEIEELEHRILILEKRIEEYRKENKTLYHATYELIKELQETKANKRTKRK